MLGNWSKSQQTKTKIIKELDPTCKMEEISRQDHIKKKEFDPDNARNRNQHHRRQALKERDQDSGFSDNGKDLTYRYPIEPRWEQENRFQDGENVAPVLGKKIVLPLVVAKYLDKVTLTLSSDGEKQNLDKYQYLQQVYG